MELSNKDKLLASALKVFPKEYVSEVLQSMPLLTDELGLKIFAMVANPDNPLRMDDFKGKERAMALFRIHRLEKLGIVQSKWVGKGNPAYEKEYSLSQAGLLIAQFLHTLPSPS